MNKNFLLFCCFCFVSSLAKRNCGVMNLLPKEIVFFKTTDYPSLIPLDDFLFCNLTFSLNSSNTNRYSLYVAYTQNSVNQDDFFDNVYFENYINVYNTSTYFQQPFNDGATALAQQGFAVFFERNNTECPLEFLNPLKLTDESQVIYIQSSYYIRYNRTRPCNWIYTAPKGYGFKLYVTYFTFKTILLVKNSTQVILNNRSLREYYSLYNEDNYLHLYLARANLSSYIPEFEFEGYISIVKKDVKKHKFKCQFTQDDNEAIWSNDPFNGMKNNAYCSHNYFLPPNYLLIVSGTTLSLEFNADTIKYYINGSNNGILIDQQLAAFKIQSDKNSAKNLTFEFVSDGSVHSSGFSLNLLKAECKCAPPIIVCDEDEYNIMESTDVYCGNLNCTFNINPCLSSITLMTLTNVIIGPDYNQTLMAVFYVKSNEDIVQEINDGISKDDPFQIYLSSANTNIFEAVTFVSPYVNGLSITLEPFEMPPLDKRITMSPNNSFVIIDTGVFDFTLFEAIGSLQNLNSQKFTFEIYSTLKNGVPIFTNESLTKSLLNKNCFSSLNPYHCTIQSSMFALFLQGQIKENLFLAVDLLPKRSSNGCLFKKTTFLLMGSSDAAEKSIALVASAEEECVINVLIDAESLTPSEVFLITSLFTTAGAENVKVFDGEKLFFEFNSASSNKYTDIRLLSHVYKIIIPKRAALLMYLNWIYEADLKSIKVDSSSYSSIVATPCYGTSKMSYFSFSDTYLFLKYEIGSFLTNFKIIDYELEDGDYFYFETSNNRTISFSNSTSIISFKNENISLHYYCDDPTSIKSGILMSVETRIDIG